MAVKDVDAKVFLVWKQIRKLRFVNPTNQEDEKHKFFISHDYNPQFQYGTLPFDPVDIRKKLQSYKKSLDQHHISHIIAKKIDKLTVWLHLLEQVGKNSKEFTKYSLEYYQKPNQKLVEYAKKIVEKKLKVEEKYDMSSSQVVACMQEQVKRYKIPWKIEEKKGLGARADNVASEKKIYIKKGEWFSKEDCKRLIVHELGVHATRAHNSTKLSYKIFSAGTAEYETTEEGLAAEVEYRKGLMTQKVLRSYAGRVVAVDLALKKSFRYVYQYLAQYFPPDEAYQLTLRVKRGLSDTSKPGGFTKDYIYLHGKQMLENMKTLKPLFVGRIALEDLKYFEKR